MSWSNQRQSLIKGFCFYVRCRTTAIMLGTQSSNPNLHKDFIASKAPDAALAEEENKVMRETTGLLFGGKGGELVAKNDGPNLDRMGEGISGEEDAAELQMTIYPRGRFFCAEDGRMFDPKDDVWPDDLKGEYKVLPFIWNYQLQGSFKESISMLSKAAGGRGENKQAGMYDAAEITAYKKVVDGNWFIVQRRVPLVVPETFIDDMGVEIPTYTENGQLRTLQRPLRAETAKGPRTTLATSEVVPEGTEFWFGIRLLNIQNLKACLETLDYKESMGMLQWRGGGKGTLVWTPCNKEGIPYEEVGLDNLTDEDLNIIAHLNAVVPGIVDIPGLDKKLPEITAAVSNTKKKKAAKKAAKDAADDTATPPAPKKRGRKSKAEKEAEANAANASSEDDIASD